MTALFITALSVRPSLLCDFAINRNSEGGVVGTALLLVYPLLTTRYSLLP